MTDEYYIRLIYNLTSFIKDKMHCYFNYSIALNVELSCKFLRNNELLYTCTRLFTCFVKWKIAATEVTAAVRRTDENVSVAPASEGLQLLGSQVVVLSASTNCGSIVFQRKRSCYSLTLLMECCTNCVVMA